MSPALSPGFAGSPQSGVSRGGRPREWTDSRSRQLIRMYLYTGYRLEVLLEAVKDSTWAPHKDAAHKILHRALGNDPRWLRPKLMASPDHYIRHLEQSDRPIHRQPTLSAVDPLGISQLSTPVKVQASVALDYTEPSLNDLGWTSTSEPIYSAEAWQQPPQYTGAFALNGSAGSPMLHRRGSVLSMTNTFMERLAFKGVPYSDAGNLWKVSRRFTMPKMGAPSPQPAASSVRASPPGHHVFPGANISSVVDYSSAGYAVAGDLLNLGSRFSLEDRRACDKISRAHEDDRCWCTVSEVLFSQFKHLASARVVPVPDPYMIRHLHELDGTARDDFGHTSLHLLASSENCQSQLLSVVAEALNQDRELLGAVNTAGQSFLHLLHPSWFLPGSRLEDLVKILKQCGFSILGRDVYGRNLFHIMRENDTSFDRIQNCALGIDTKALNKRDAFGRMPLRSRPSIQAARSIRRLIAAQRLTIPASGSPPATESESRILAQTKLLKIIYDAVSTEAGEGDPTREDLEGRNGFHALAEVILSMKSIKKHANIGVKRKHDKASTDGTVNEEPVRRIELMEGLIGARADVNHHNIAGDTPLMTFVVRLSDGETKAENLEVRNIINRLVEAGADMERRNRRGETALAIAARHGQKVAVDALLKLGANPYVRNSDGDSILGVVDSMWRVSTGDSTGSYEACRKLLCGPPMLVEPKQCPSIIDEWSFGQQRAVA